MKEVGHSRYAGPFRFEDIPFQNFIQSPIGLVPKAGNQTRLIFHLSYDFKNGNSSLNYHTPKELCSVKYKDLDYALDLCLRLLKKHGKNAIIFFGKTDQKSAFRLIPVLISHRWWLLIKTEDPKTGEVFFFVDKCLPFGVSISCAIFQEFSDSLKHMVEYLLCLDDVVSNYLDDFLFIAFLKDECDRMVSTFLLLCKRINCPVTEEKTEWATVIITFLGMLLDGKRHCMCIPKEKRTRALSQLNWIKSKKKVTIKEIQCLTGLLNFLNKAIVPGRVFTRQMYAKLRLKDNKGRDLKQYHHTNLSREFKNDCNIWVLFLQNAGASVLCIPFVDLKAFQTSQEIQFYTDVSGTIGYGSFFAGRWHFGECNQTFLAYAKLSIEFLELFALCAGILTWDKYISNTRVIIFCDNQAVVQMVNNMTSSCQNCMFLLRLLVLNGLQFNRRVWVKYVKSTDNILADSLSRSRFDIFWKHAPDYTEIKPDRIASSIWPIEKFWTA